MEVELNWERLKRLRDIFLGAESQRAPTADYWRDLEDLVQYDASFAQRIAWKWDTVLELIDRRGGLQKILEASQQPIRILDWGCGSGVAGRSVVRALSKQDSSRKFEVYLRDRSALAVAFSRNRYIDFPNVEVFSEWESSQILKGFDVLTVSHVLSEAGQRVFPEGLEPILPYMQTVLWVEPGTKAVSRKLSEVRKLVLPKFVPMAPCPHSLACPVLLESNERDWCHSFAKPPSEASTSAYWREFAKRMNVDLRSLPYSFLWLQRKNPHGPELRSGSDHWMLGRSKIQKGKVGALLCHSSGELGQQEYSKRRHPKIYKQLNEDYPYPWVKTENESDLNE